MPRPYALRSLRKSCAPLRKFCALARFTDALSPLRPEVTSPLLERLLSRFHLDFRKLARFAHVILARGQRAAVEGHPDPGLVGERAARPAFAKATVGKRAPSNERR
jgi:hypothetical protein